MGFRYRKSISLGGGFRINLSKTGIGYSWGVPGARITKTAKGAIRTTVGIPGTGLSYSVEKSKKSNNSLANTSHSSPICNNVDVRSTEIVNIENYQPTEYSFLLNQIKKTRILNLISIILMAMGAFALIELWAIAFFGIGFILFVLVHTKFPVNVEYEMDDLHQKQFRYMTEIWNTINRSCKIWQNLSSSKVLNSKIHGGAKQTIDRRECKISQKLPYYLKTNIEPIYIKLKNENVIFLPDKILITSWLKVGAISYKALSIEPGVVKFVEDAALPADANVIGTTWLKVNKNGTPDKRYKDNRQLPICKYGELAIKSDNLLYLELMFSNSSLLDLAIEYMKNYNEIDI